MDNDLVADSDTAAWTTERLARLQECMTPAERERYVVVMRARQSRATRAVLKMYLCRFGQPGREMAEDL